MKQIVFTVLFSIVSSVALAHPGRMDKNNCHKVTKDYKYNDGRVLKAGTTHCHPKIEGMKMEDGGAIIAEDQEEEVKAKGKTK